MARAKVKTKSTEAILSKSAFILLDRSGSMGRNWVETIGAMNAYVAELAADETSKDTKVTLALFDAPQRQIDFTVLRKDVAASDWKAVDPSEAAPRGYTPLFDAIGRISGLAQEAKADRTVLVVITDGAENASTEITRGEAKDVLDQCRAKGWPVVFIGADFDAFAQAGSVGGARGQTLSMSTGNYAETTKTLARKMRAYGNLAGSSADPEFLASANATMSFTDEDRAEAAGKKAAKGADA